MGSERAREKISQDYPHVLHAEQVCELLGLNIRTVLNMAHAGTLPAFRLPGTKRLLFYREEVLDYLDDHRIGPGGEDDEVEPAVTAPKRPVTSKAAKAAKAAPARRADDTGSGAKEPAKAPARGRSRRSS